VFADGSQIPALDTEDTSPEQILDRRLVKKGNAAVPQVLITGVGCHLGGFLRLQGKVFGSPCLGTSKL